MTMTVESLLSGRSAGKPGAERRRRRVRARREDARILPTALVAEDDEDCLLGIKILLRQLGYRVVTAEDGEEAWQRLQRLGGVDLLVTDLVMPRMDGIDLMAAAREIDPDVPVIAITGADDMDYRLCEAQMQGAACVLPKPFENDEFEAAVEDATS